MSEHAPLASRLLDIDPDVFRAKFDAAPFRIRHGLATHPLFTLPRLVALAQALPPASLEYNGGDLPISADPRLTPRTGLSAYETIRRIETANSWMALLNVEQDPEYGRLLRDCLAEVAVLSEPIRPGMTQPEGYIFVSSARAITPYHMDPEHNLLLQIRGEKTLTVFDGHDRSLLTAEQVEDFYCGTPHRNLPFRDDWAPKGQAFVLQPGDGLHVPVTFPHYVQVSNDYTISFSVTFRTPDLDRLGLVHRFNRKLRRVGIRPAEPGRSLWRDTVKSQTEHLIERARRTR